jgi:hypothetical protein
MKAMGLEHFTPDPGVPNGAPVIDSGASFHMGKPGEIRDVVPCDEHIIQVADERTLVATTSGSLRLESGVVLEHVVIVPGLSRTLISVSALFAAGMHVVFAEDRCRVFGRPILHGAVNSGVYELQRGAVGVEPREPASAPLISAPPSTHITNGPEHWHHRLGHLNYRSIIELERSGAVKGLKIVGPRSSSTKCEACALSKVIARAAPKTATRPQAAKDSVCHADLAGPMQRSIHGNKYFLALQWLGYTHVFFLKLKSDAAEAFEKYIAMIGRRSTELPSTLNIVRSDNGGEFEGAAFQQICGRVGIAREYS